MRTRLEPGVIAVGGGEQSAGGGDVGAGEPARVPRAVQALVMLDGDRRQRRERGRRCEHPLGQIGVHPHSLEL